MFRHFALLCSFSALLIDAPQLYAAKGFDLATADWSVTSPHNLAVNPPTDDMGSAIFELVKKLDPETTQSYSDLCPLHPWEFADLHRSGTYSLVIALSDGRFCGQNLIIDKTEPGFREYTFSSPFSSRFSGPEVEDLTGKGDFVVIQPTDFTDFSGMNTHPCIADFPVIYGWTGDGYSDVSKQYTHYYEQRLVALKAQIDAVPTPPPAVSSGQSGERGAVPRARPWGQWGRSTDGSGAATPSLSEANPIRGTQPPPAVHNVVPANACTKAEAAKIERFLNINKDAGLEDALKWASSSDPDERIFGAAVLKDIGTPTAVNYLQALTHDTDGLVAKHAEAALPSLGGPPAPNTIDLVKVGPPQDSSK